MSMNKVMYDEKKNSVKSVLINEDANLLKTREGRKNDNEPANKFFYDSLVAALNGHRLPKKKKKI